MRDVIARKVKFALKEMATGDLSTMVEELLENILRSLFHNVQKGIRSVYIVVVKLILDLQRKVVTGETLHAHRATLFNTDGPA